MRKKSFVKQAKKYWPFYVMAMPACVCFFINNYIAMGGLTRELPNDLKKR